MLSKAKQFWDPQNVQRGSKYPERLNPQYISRAKKSKKVSLSDSIRKIPLYWAAYTAKKERNILKIIPRFLLHFSRSKTQRGIGYVSFKTIN